MLSINNWLNKLTLLRKSSNVITLPWLPQMLLNLTGIFGHSMLFSLALFSPPDENSPTGGERERERAVVTRMSHPLPSSLRRHSFTLSLIALGKVKTIKVMDHGFLLQILRQQHGCNGWVCYIVHAACKACILHVRDRMNGWDRFGLDGWDGRAEKATNTLFLVYSK